MIILVCTVQACLRTDILEVGSDPRARRLEFHYPPIAPNKWKYGETIVTLSDSGRTLTFSGNGAMANNDYMSIKRVVPPWYDSINSIISVIIPEGVTSIGDWTFVKLENLTSITIPNSVTSIGDGAFAVCRSLTSVTIPNSVTSIGEGVFQGCTSLTSIIVQNPTPLPELFDKYSIKAKIFFAMISHYKFLVLVVGHSRVLT